MKKVTTLRKYYDHTAKMVFIEEVQGYEFTAAMSDGTPVRCYARKSETGRTWECVDAAALMVLGSLYSTRTRAIESVSQKIAAKMSPEFYAEQTKKALEQTKNYTEVQNNEKI